MSHSPWAGLKIPSAEFWKLNWTIKKKCMVEAKIPAELGQRDTVSLLELFLCISGQIYMENYLVPQIIRMTGPDYFNMEDFPHFTCFQGQIHWTVTQFSILFLWQIWHLLVESWKIKFLSELKPWVFQFIEKYWCSVTTISQWSLLTGSAQKCGIKERNLA